MKEELLWNEKYSFFILTPSFSPQPHFFLIFPLLISCWPQTIQNIDLLGAGSSTHRADQSPDVTQGSVFPQGQWGPGPLSDSARDARLRKEMAFFDFS